MGALHVHEFMSLDGVFDTLTWTFEFGFDPRMGDALIASMSGCTGILLGRTTYEMFEQGWSTASQARRRPPTAKARALWRNRSGVSSRRCGPRGGAQSRGERLD